MKEKTIDNCFPEKAPNRIQEGAQRKEEAACSRSITPPSPVGHILSLQRNYGNRYVQRMINLAAKGIESGEVGNDLESAIQSERGSGHSLDSRVRTSMEQSFNADFSSVRVHTGAKSDSLNRALSSRAFTTGNDIFFKEGEYNPAGSTGKELLAHELTHVLQQGGGIQGKLTVGSPDDEHEQEADTIARSVVAGESIQRQPEEEEEKIQQ